MFQKNNDLSIQDYNIINTSNSKEVKYDISNKDTYFEVYISPQKQVCIVGRKDNNYIVWCSMTNVDDKETNKSIFDYVVNNTFNIYSDFSKVLEKEVRQKVYCWHKGQVKRRKEGVGWYTSLGHYSVQKEVHGNSFSRDIVKFYNEETKKCNYRIINDLYYDILCEYLEILNESNEPYHYCQVKALIEIIKSETYMKICPDQKYRLKYLECIKRCSDLYNRYMTEIR